MTEKTKERTSETVACSVCGRTAPKSEMVNREGKWYCCDDCAEGKECGCGQ